MVAAAICAAAVGPVPAITSLGMACSIHERAEAHFTRQDDQRRHQADITVIGRTWSTLRPPVHDLWGLANLDTSGFQKLQGAVTPRQCQVAKHAQGIGR